MSAAVSDAGDLATAVHASRVNDRYPKPARAGSILALLILSVLVAYIDRQLIALVVPGLKASLRLSDTKIGLLQGVAINLFFGLASIPFGFLIDRGRRIRILVISILTWSVFTALSGLANGFGALFVCRMGVGIAEAALLPGAWSIIADLYDSRQRTVASLVFYGGTILSASAAIAGSGYVLGFIEQHQLGWAGVLGQPPSWRLMFLVACVPGLAVGLLLAFVREPDRIEAHDLSSSGSTFMDPYLRSHWPAILGLCLGIVLAGIGIDAILMWVPAILSRESGISTAESGKVLGALLAIGSLVGIGLASLVSRLRQRAGDGSAPLFTLLVGSVVAAVAAMGLAFIDRPSLLRPTILLFFAFGYMANSVGPVLVVSVAPNRLRGRMIAIWTSIGVAAATLWPMVIGLISDTLFPSKSGLQTSFAAVVIFCSALSPIVLLSNYSAIKSLLQTQGSNVPDEAAAPSS